MRSSLKTLDLKRPTRPVKHVNEDFAFLRRGPNRRNALHRSTGGFVNGLAVDRQPTPNRAKPFLKFRLDYAVRLRAHIEQKIPAAAGHFDQRANQRLRRLVFMIV